MLAKRQALRAGRVASASWCSGAHIRVRARFVHLSRLRVDAGHRIGQSLATRLHACCARLRKPCALRAHGGAAQLRWSRRRFELIAKKQKRVSETETDASRTDAATCAIALRRTCAKASPLGLRPNTPESAPGGPQAHADRDWKERSSFC